MQSKSETQQGSGSETSGSCDQEDGGFSAVPELTRPAFGKMARAGKVASLEIRGVGGPPGFRRQSPSRLVDLTSTNAILWRARSRSRKVVRTPGANACRRRQPQCRRRASGFSTVHQRLAVPGKSFNLRPGEGTVWGFPPVCGLSLRDSDGDFNSHLVVAIFAGDRLLVSRSSALSVVGIVPVYLAPFAGTATHPLRSPGCARAPLPVAGLRPVSPRCAYRLARFANPANLGEQTRKPHSQSTSPNDDVVHVDFTRPYPIPANQNRCAMTFIDSYLSRLLLLLCVGPDAWNPARPVPAGCT
ncbi:MAG: hypothetical protein BJ554DRAFT_1774, partial [Olpidium bornovanus]